MANSPLWDSVFSKALTCRMPIPRPLAASYVQRAKAIQTDSFFYCLPQSHIASYPLKQRAASKLLVVPRGEAVRHHTFHDLPSLLPQESLVVLNSSKVIPARIPVIKSTGGRAEVLLLEPVRGPPSVALQSGTAGQLWRAFLGGRRIVEGDILYSKDGTLTATVVGRQRQGATIRLDSTETASLSCVLGRLGRAPLPPYIKRPAEKDDKHEYQTVYAHEEGSVAAPTAGLHMTEDVLDDLHTRGIRTREVVLHVGAGTFQQVDSVDAGGHEMHEESIAVKGSVVADLLAQNRLRAPVVAVGTTSVRTLESLYWFGVRLLRERIAPERLEVDQWEPYERLDQVGILPPVDSALAAVLEWCGGRDGEVYGRTRLLIVPGYPFKMVNALVTNFHQPRSTLLMLVSAFHGGDPEHLVHVYNSALQRNYRFLSYGDSSIYTDGSISVASQIDCSATFP